MKIVALSDFHGDLLANDLIPECDVVCICGDFSPLSIQGSTQMNGAMAGWIHKEFIPWLEGLPCKKVIVIAGNHDFVTMTDWFNTWFRSNTSDKVVYLNNESYTYGGVIFYGCPYSDMEHWAWSAITNPDAYRIPESTDVVLVHQAPNWMDLGKTFTRWEGWMNFGSDTLLNAISEAMPFVVLCGHIHGGNHNPVSYQNNGKVCMMANSSVKDEQYDLYYAPRVVLMEPGEVNIEAWHVLGE